MTCEELDAIRERRVAAVKNLEQLYATYGFLKEDAPALFDVIEAQKRKIDELALAAATARALLPERVAELAEAERDGRLIVLPEGINALCKKVQNSDVYWLNTDVCDEPIECTLCDIGLNEQAELVARVFYEDGVAPVLGTVYDGYIGFVDSEEIMKDADIPISEYGRTLFLTLEEAKAALASLKGGGGA